MAGLSPFLNVHFQQQGLSGQQIGWLAALPPLVGIIAVPVAGIVADRWHRHRTVIAICAAMSGLTALLFLVLEDFLSLALLLIAHAAFRNPLIAIVDAMVVRQANRGGPPYGHQRLWGTVSYVVVLLGLGWVLTNRTLDLVFWLYAALVGFGCMVAARRLPVEGELAPVGTWPGLKLLAGQRSYGLLLLSMLLVGAGMAAYSGFVGLHLISLGGGAGDIALAVAAGASLEIIVMYLGVRWLRRFESFQVLSLACLGVALVWLGVGLATSPAAVVATVAALGLFLGVVLVEMVVAAARLAPPGYSASAQSLLGSAMGGVGATLGAILGGQLWERAGGGAVFLFAGGAALLAFGLLRLGTTRPKAPEA